MNGTGRSINQLFSTVSNIRQNPSNSVLPTNLFGSDGRYSSSLSGITKSSSLSNGQTIPGTSNSLQTFKELPSPGNQISLGKNVAETSFSNIPSTSGTYRELGTILPSQNRTTSFNLRPGLEFSQGKGGLPPQSSNGRINAMPLSLQPNTFPNKVSPSSANSTNSRLSSSRPAVEFAGQARGSFASGLKFTGSTTPSILAANSSRFETSNVQGIRQLWNSQAATQQTANNLRNVATTAKTVGAGATTALSFASGPAGAIAAAAQAIGEGVNQIQTSQTNTQISKDYSHNISQNGVNVGLNADLIRTSQQNTNNYASAGGSIGALFGPLGALAGHAIGSALSNSDINLRTASSFAGKINPSDTGIATSASTAGASGVSTMQDNVN